jgi:malonate decarboxylase delta subunit
VFEFPATKTLKQRAHVGVVGSGDLEVLIQPNNEGKVIVEVRTGTDGFGAVWKTVLERFFKENDTAMNVSINDFGATPGMVTFRLAQALEVSKRYD